MADAAAAAAVAMEGLAAEAPAPPGLVPVEQLLFAQQQLAAAQVQVNTLLAALTAAQAPQSGSKLAQPAPFRGSDEKHVQVQAWLFSLDCYFRAANIVSDRQKINFAVCLLQGHAAQWYRLQCVRAPEDEPFTTWDDLKAALEKQFKPVNCEKRARDRLAALKQVTSVNRYIQEFTNVCLQIPDLHSSEQYYRFLQGLKSNVRREVELQNPETFDEATRIAERIDSISFAHRSELFRATAPRPAYSRPEPMELGQMTVKPRRAPASSDPPTRPAPRLTAEERRRLRDTNSCFYCRQPGHIMADCPVRPKTRPSGQGNDKGTHPPETR